jgi:hypothetical protein
MAVSKDQVHKHFNILGPSGLNGKSITGVDVWQAGGVWVVEINYTGGPYYIKLRGSQSEHGGTADWGTGTQP